MYNMKLTDEELKNRLNKIEKKIDGIYNDAPGHFVVICLLLILIIRSC